MSRKLLLYSYDWAPLVGGVQTVMMDLALGICAWSKAHPEDSWEVVLATQTPAAGMDDTKLPFAVVRQPSLLRLIRLMIAADIVHLAAPTALPLLVAQVLRRRLCIEHHGFQASCPNGLLFFEPTRTPCPGHYMARRYTKCIECNRGVTGSLGAILLLMKTKARRWLSNWAAVNIVPTEWLGTVLQLKNQITVHHGVAVPDEDPPGTRVPPVIAYQGRLVSTKGVDVLLAAAEQLQNEGIEFCLRIIGEGPEGPALDRQARRLREGTVSFLGHVPPERFKEALEGVSIIVVPSLGGEVFGLVVAESMLRCKALVISDIGALTEVAGESGVVTKTGSPASLADALRHLVLNPEAVTKSGRQGRERAARFFRIDEMVKKHLAIYEGLARGQR